jgi:DNA-binding transcriptional ArsR family regulator
VRYGGAVDVDTAARVFGALGDPTRLAIVARLAEGDATVKELTEPFELTQQAVSLHLKTLESVGLVARRKEGRARPATLEVERLVEAIGWVDGRRREWVERHQRLAEHFAGLQAEEQR